MKILGIETSCDETAASIVEDGSRVLSNVVASSQKMHVASGGIIPENAAREQTKSIIPVIEQASLNQNYDAIAVTVGPGLIGSLLVGVEAAKTLAFALDKPIIPVNHLIAHIYANWIARDDPPEFPAICLVVSGGHTDFVLMRSHDQIEWVGGTRDDAAGEAFDKTARLIGLGYPGGPAVSAEAEKYQETNSKIQNLDLFPRPMTDTDDLDMSFSGLKTAVLNYTKSNPDFDNTEIAAQIQEAIVDTLVDKSLKAVKKHEPKSFLLAGGVSANSRLKSKLGDVLQRKAKAISLYVPSPIFCTDNAAMIASCAYFQNSPLDWREISANPSLHF